MATGDAPKGLRAGAAAKRKVPAMKPADQRDSNPAASLSALPSLRTTSASKSLSAKHCVFLCGRTLGDRDDVDGDEELRWGYNDGSGSADYYCERTWRCQVQHKVPGRDRVLFLKSMAEDKTVQASFHAKRTEYVKKLLKIKAGGGKAAGRRCTDLFFTVRACAWPQFLDVCFVYFASCWFEYIQPDQNQIASLCFFSDDELLARISRCTSHSPLIWFGAGPFD